VATPSTIVLRNVLDLETVKFSNHVCKIKGSYIFNSGESLSFCGLPKDELFYFFSYLTGIIVTIDFQN
jgi:hypothetical protein